MRAFLILFAALLTCTAASEAQRYAVGETAAFELVLMPEGEPGAAGDTVLTADHFTALEVELSSGRSDANARYNLLFTLTPLGAHRLAQAARKHQGRSLVLQSRERTFNTLRLDGPFSGRRLLWRVLLPEPVAHTWAQHMVGTVVSTGPATGED